MTIGPLQSVFHTAVPGPEVLFLLIFPPIVWGADEAYRAVRRARAVTGQPGVAGGARATVEAEAFQEEESWPPAS